jgi:mitochondrial fission protein ELM1
MTSGEAGMISQALGLAETLGFAEPVQKRIAIKAPWLWTPNLPFLASLNAIDRSNSDPVHPPWPDILVTCGRKAAFLSLAIRKLSPGKTRTIHIQDPRFSSAQYDLVVVPEHDRLRGDNVIVTHGALHRVSRARLQLGAAEFAPELAHLPKPLIAVLLGGTNHSYAMTPDWCGGFGATLAQMARTVPCGLMITPSRRTGEAQLAALKAGLKGAPATIWSGTGRNPYFGYLGLADAIVATCDSTSMISEACATGKPVLVARLPGRSPRFEAFFDRLLAQGVIRWFDGRLELWPNGRLDDMDAIGAEIRRRLRLAEI